MRRGNIDLEDYFVCLSINYMVFDSVTIIILSSFMDFVHYGERILTIEINMSDWLIIDFIDRQTL